MEQSRGVHSVLVGKPEGKRPLGRHRHRWEDNFKMSRKWNAGGLGGGAWNGSMRLRIGIGGGHL